MTSATSIPSEAVAPCENWGTMMRHVASRQSKARSAEQRSRVCVRGKDDAGVVRQIDVVNEVATSTRRRRKSCRSDCRLRSRCRGSTCRRSDRETERRALIGARQLYDAGAEAFTNVGIYERDRLIARRPAGRASDRPAIPTTHKVLSTRPAASQSRASLMENCKALNGHGLDFVKGHDR